MGKVIPREMLAAFIEAFELLPLHGDPLEAVRSARQGGAPVVLEANSTPASHDSGHRVSKGAAAFRGKIPEFRR